MAHSITVDHEVSVTSADGVARPRAPSTSGYSLFNHRPEPTNVNISKLRPRAKSYSNLGAHLEPKFEFDGHTFIDENGNFRRHHGIQELIDFLKNHPPPADNFMSIPDAATHEERGAWSKFRKLATGRRKSDAKSPDPIRLPDSAISGITTGGHRHIAISIPLDASPFGRAPRTQYPVYQTKNGKAPQSRYGPTRAVLNDKGVVTVLRTVDEDQEQESTDHNAPRVKSLPPLPRSNSTAHDSHIRSGSTHSNGRGKVSEYFGVSSSPPRSSAGAADQFKRANEASRELQNYGQTATASNNDPRQDNNNNNNNNPPTRGSSLVANRFVFPSTTSIDALMSETAPAPDMLQVDTRDDTKDTVSYQGSISRSINTASDSDPVVSEAKRVKTSAPLGDAPVLVSKRKEENELTVITKNPLALARGDGAISPTPSIASSASQNRRERVRDKKRRDMEALRSAQNSRQTQYSEPGTPDAGRVLREQDEDDEEEEQVKAEPEASKSPRKSKPPPLPLKSPSRPSLCAIMVVNSIEPSPSVHSAKSETVKTPSPQSPSSESEPSKSPFTRAQEEVAQLGMTQIVMASSPLDIEPPLASPPLDHGFPKPPKVKPQLRHKPPTRVPSTGSNGKPHMTSPVVSFNSSNNPTPPSSIKGSPVQKSTGNRSSRQSVDRSSKQSVDRSSKQSVDRSSKQSTVSVDRSSKQSSIDERNSKQSPVEHGGRPANRNSISNRGSWNSVRDADRKHHRDSRFGSRSLPKPLVLPKEDVDEAKVTPNSDIVRRYDVYREYRIREMERRLRRLERNGDIWLRALVPVLENLNRTLSSNTSHGEHDRAQGWVSDEDFVDSLSPPRGRTLFMGSRSRGSRMMPRPGATEREFLEHLVRTKEELEAGNISDDMSGFDTIEPLMRELAGRSRLSFEARSMALTEDDENLFRNF